MENGNGYSHDFLDGLGNVTSVRMWRLVEEREYDCGRLRRFRRGTDGVVETDYSDWLLVERG